MNPAIKILPHYTYEDYCHWEGRWELIDGIPYWRKGLLPVSVLQFLTFMAKHFIPIYL